MRLTQKLAPLFVVLVAALLALPVISKLHQNPVSANAQVQVQPPAAAQQSQSDVKATPKQSKPQLPAVGVTAPTNDNCASAVAVAGCPFTDTKSNAGATTETGEPTPCGTIGATMWYSYTNTRPNPVSVTASTCTGTTVDTVIAAYKVTGGACVFAGFVNVACNDDFCGLESSIGFTADPGATYEIQVGGFASSTGSITTTITTVEQVPQVCPAIVINGTLGSGAPGFTGVQFSGDQTGRLNRNGIASSCCLPKTCLIFDPTGLRKFDAYKIPNASGQDVCVSINLTESANGQCNLQSNAYLDTYAPGSICTGYLGDPGLSTGFGPPTPTNMSVTVPVGHTLIVVVQTTNPGEVGCAYTVTVTGNLCVQYNYCVQDDNNPKRFVQINTITGAYKFTDCGKGLTLSGTGGVVTYFCKTELFDQGPNPKKPDRFVDVLVNPCTNVGDAFIQFGSNSISLHDSNIRNNMCACPMQQ